MTKKEHASGQKVSIRETADEFGTTILKIRKILITADVFHSEISEKVRELFSCGKTIEEIQSELKLSRASVYSYLPYVKTIYNIKEISANAQRLQIYRSRRQAVFVFQSAVNANQLTGEIIWDTVTAFAGYPFYTIKGIKFSYTVHGFEMQVDRKKKTITKATVLLFINRVQELRSAGEKITGPKKVGTFGASYLFPVFVRIGLIEPVGGQHDTRT
ncbi:hypothetical protein [Murimonas intestini]|uniref:hypothetical protein n=1 Tax=Murimonas intestini TaxID=1337051 RepID=UPI00214AD705|nr:hypothetical protein [Murimonas intestini]MCR1839591.1 hypothetical protein [Murimonas intestini]MCR1866434.1 hypothetical protein [Murimonas intestini]MCR1882448.1 hypothetical protein [Murimonas intestini]